jgi:hypothetical protein
MALSIILNETTSLKAQTIKMRNMLSDNDCGKSFYHFFSNTNFLESMVEAAIFHSFVILLFLNKNYLMTLLAH